MSFVFLSDHHNDWATVADLYQKLSSAHDTLSDPVLREAYDLERAHNKYCKSTSREATTHQAEATEKEWKRAVEETTNRERKYRASQGELRTLKRLRSIYEFDILDAKREIQNLRSDLKRIQDQEGKAMRRERARRSWWTYLSAPLYGKVDETEEQKQQRDIERLQRLSCRTIKVAQLTEKQRWLRTLNNALENLDIETEAAKSKTSQDEEACSKAARRQGQLRHEQQAASRRAAERELQQAMWQAAAARVAKAKEDREAQDYARRARAAQEAAETAMRNANGQASSTNFYSFNRTFLSTNNSECQHDAFWPKVHGKQLCSRCHRYQTLFVFQCPKCQTMACAGCRQVLKGKIDWN